MRRTVAVGALLVLMLAGGAIFFSASYERGTPQTGWLRTGISDTSTSAAQRAVTSFHDERETVTVGGADVRVLLADTPAERTQGLSGRPRLSSDEGMLFIFDKEGMYGFWMKDMRFAIDILWISSDGQIVHIEEGVPPESYPASFGPREPARYVLELPAGFTKAHNIAVGDAVALPR